MKRFYCFLVAAILFCACSEDWKNGKRLGEKPVLFPDYAQTTIPYNITSRSARTDVVCRSCWKQEW